MRGVGQDGEDRIVKRTDHKSLNKKEHPLYFMYPLCERIYEGLVKIGKADLAVKRSSVERLHVNEDPERAIRAEACKTISFFLAAAGITLIISLGLLASNKSAIHDGKLARKATGEGEEKYDLIVKEDDSSEEITVIVSEQKPSGDELEAYLNEAVRRLEKALLGDNPSSENVNTDLNFVTSVEGMPVAVTWEGIDTGYIYSTGRIRHEAVSEPVIVYLTARLVYFDEVRIITFPIRLVPAEIDPGVPFTQKLEEALNAEDIESSGSQWFNLPQVLDGKKLDWEEKKDLQWVWVMLLGTAATAAVIPVMHSETDSREKKREEEMIRDYPEIVSKFVLLVTAGMTCRAAWEKICADYAAGGGKRFAYEEMVRSAGELSFGKSEAGVYEEFGRRCNIAAYRKFGTLLANNLRRGSRELTVLLEQEADAAFNGRLEDVKKRAAQAGTRLLLPMFGMLCLVFAIVMIPAFSVFGG